jgi:hypothetical protein
LQKWISACAGKAKTESSVRSVPLIALADDLPDDVHAAHRQHRIIEAFQDAGHSIADDIGEDSFC